VSYESVEPGRLSDQRYFLSAVVSTLKKLTAYPLQPPRHSQWSAIRYNTRKVTLGAQCYWSASFNDECLFAVLSRTNALRFLLYVRQDAEIVCERCWALSTELPSIYRAQSMSKEKFGS
jgi:hypothetical protein